MLINRANLADLFRGYQLAFQGAWEQAPSLWDRIAMEVPSTTSEEKYAWLGTMPRFREWIGDRVLQGIKSHDYTVKNRTFENTIEVPREAIEDDRFGVYRPMIQALGMEAKTHPDELVFAALAAGFSTQCYDGQFFFDTDHPVENADGSLGTWSNFGGGGGTAWYLLDVSRPIKPIIFQKRRDYAFTAMDNLQDEGVFMRSQYRYGVDARANVGYGLPHLAYASRQTLDMTNYAAARAGMGSLKGDKGKVLNIRPGLLLVPPSLEKAALDIVKAERLANGQTNTMQNTAGVLVAPWLA